MTSVYKRAAVSPPGRSRTACSASSGPVSQSSQSIGSFSLRGGHLGCGFVGEEVEDELVHDVRPLLAEQVGRAGYDGDLGVG
jgi:hypothetical protein